MGGVVDSPSVFRHFKVSISGNRYAKWQPFFFSAITSFTPAILLIFAGLLFWHRITQDHISCYTPPEEDVRSTAVNQYCFITGTYTVTSYSEKYKNTKRNLPYPGIGPVLGTESDTELKYHLYFQWVPFVFLVQTILLVLPKIIWKSLSQDKLSRYCHQIDPNDEDAGKSNKDEPDPDNKIGSTGESAEKANEFDMAAKRFYRNVNNQSGFCYSFIFCELLNLAVIALAFILGDKLLTGDFWYLGRDWLSYMETNNQTESSLRPDVASNPLDKIFPKMSKCEFKRYGPGGGIISHDILCVMTLNVFHDKIFLFLWFWFLLLIAIQAVYLLFQAVVLVFKELQLRLILRRLEVAFLDKENRMEDIHFQMSMNEIDNQLRIHTKFERMARDCLCSLTVGDWFLLYAISQCTDTAKFTKFFQSLVGKMEKKRRKRYEAKYALEQSKILTEQQKYMDKAPKDKLYPKLSWRDNDATVMIDDGDGCTHPLLDKDMFTKDGSPQSRSRYSQCNSPKCNNFQQRISVPDGVFDEVKMQGAQPPTNSAHFEEKIRVHDLKDEKDSNN